MVNVNIICFHETGLLVINEDQLIEFAFTFIHSRF